MKSGRGIYQQDEDRTTLSLWKEGQNPNGEFKNDESSSSIQMIE
jgi:hypothetical protein